MIKKWLPFILLFAVILVSTGYLMFGNTISDYEPDSDDPRTIYREACRHCHGDRGQGTGLLYPAFEENLNPTAIEKAIVGGSFLMPAFNQIKGDTLRTLVRFIHTKSYLK